MYAEDAIRKIRPGEEKVVCRLVARVFNEFVAPDYPSEGIEEFFRYADPKAMAGRIARGNIVLVAEADDRLVFIRRADLSEARIRNGGTGTHRERHHLHTHVVSVWLITGDGRRGPRSETE